MVLFSIFIIAGGFYNILTDPYWLIPLQNGQFVTVHPYLSEQTVYESLFAIITNSAMLVGMFISYRSTQVAYDRGKANMYLIIGIALFVAGISGNYLILNLKRSILR